MLQKCSIKYKPKNAEIEFKSELVKMKLFSIFGLATVAIATTVDEGFDYDSLGLKKPNKGSDEPTEADKVIHTRPTHSP